MTPAAELRVAHTADLGAATRHAARALLDDVFDDMADEDWDHALGGMHALLWEGAELIGHASVIQRQLLYGGRAWRTGYVEAVAVRADRRRGGRGGTLMDAVERIIRGAYELGALGSTHAGRPLLCGAGLAALAWPLLGAHPGRHHPDARGGRKHLRPPRDGPAGRLPRAHLRLA